RGVEAGKYGIALARPRLAHRFDLVVGMSGGDARDLLPRAVRRMALDEDDFKRLHEAGDALDRRLDIAALVARGNDDRHGTHLGGPSHRAANGEMPQAELTDERQRRQEAVNEPP